MSWFDWAIVIFCGGFFLAMVASLIAFVVRIFREAKPYERKR